MKYIQLIRWPNLVIIAATMLLVRYFVVWPGLSPFGADAITPVPLFLLLVLSFVLLASAGYVINDIAVTDVDSINKPNKVLVGRSISFKNAYNLYYFLNGLVVAISLFLGYMLHSWRLSMIILMMIGLLWFYSKKYKRMNLIGNVVVAFASSMALMIVWLSDFFYLSLQPELFADASDAFPAITTTLMAYTLFSFLTSLIREMVKDLEDMEGDKRFGCKTFPVVAGKKTAKLAVIAVGFILFILIAYWQFVLFQKTFFLTVGALVVTNTILLYIMLRLFKSEEKEDFRFVANAAKLLMISGMISMLFLA